MKNKRNYCVIENCYEKVVDKNSRNSYDNGYCKKHAEEQRKENANISRVLNTAFSKMFR